MSFISLDDARTELRIDSEEQDDYLQKLVDRTDAILLAYIDFETEEAFYYEYGQDTPKGDVVEAAAAMVIRNLYDNGDADPLSDGVKMLLRQVRAPRVG